jgi:HEAT repeat protein
VAGSGRQNADPLLIAALLTGATLADAAKSAGVGEQTARRRLRDPEFRARLDTAGSELIDAAVRALAGHMEEAVATLADLLRDAPFSVRLGAARTILQLGPPWLKKRALEKSVDELKRSLAEDEPDD